MNCWYGRGGLRVDVRPPSPFTLSPPPLHTCHLMYLKRLLIWRLEVLVVEETASGDAERSLDGRERILVFEYFGDTSR